VRRAAAQVVAAHHGHRFMMRPEFLLNFILFSPSQKEVENSYRTIFPSILGVQLSNRMNAERFKGIMEQANEIWAVDQARAGAMVTGFLDQLKGDMSKIYDIEWRARQNDEKWRYCCPYTSDRLRRYPAVGSSDLKGRNLPYGGPSSRTYGSRWRRDWQPILRPMLTAAASPPTAPTSTSAAPLASGREPTAAIVRLYGRQTCRAPRRGRMRRSARVV
jgi:hypothetical protein